MRAPDAYRRHDFRDWISDSTVDVTLDFVLLPQKLSISMKAYTFLGSRDSYKPYKYAIALLSAYECKRRSAFSFGHAVGGLC